MALMTSAFPVKERALERHELRHRATASRRGRQFSSERSPCPIKTPRTLILVKDQEMSTGGGGGGRCKSAKAQARDPRTSPH